MTDPGTGDDTDVMATFEETAEGIRVHLEEHEAGLLRHLLDEMKTLLEADIRVDPVNERLFPDAYESDEDSASYHELVGDELRSTKREAADRLRSALGSEGPFDDSLPREDVAAWLPVLTDIRLAIGTRNDVTEETMGREVDPDEPGAAGLLVLHWVGWVQESLLEVLMTESK